MLRIRHGVHIRTSASAGQKFVSFIKKCCYDFLYASTVPHEVDSRMMVYHYVLHNGCDKMKLKLCEVKFVVCIRMRTNNGGLLGDEFDGLESAGACRHVGHV